MALAQVSQSGRLTGTVTDPTGAVIVGASVQVRDEVMGSVIQTSTGSSGQFVIANLRAGSYAVTVTAAGFNKAEFRGVEIVVAGTYGLDVKLSIGSVNTTIVVQAGEAVLETQATAVTTRISGRPITQLPLVTRNAVELTLVLPGVQTTGRPADSTVLGLPIGAINITYDGINAQDNFNKINDGFATEIVPNVDAVGEFSVSIAALGAEQSGEGAVQIRFETQRGGNEYHGGLWWYHRNDALNANYYFNNLAGLPKDRMRLNQFGYKLGGPILKGKLYFFHAFDFYKFPRSVSRTRTILTDDALQGRYTYAVSSLPSTVPPWVTCDAIAKRCTADLLAMAGNSGFPSSLDPAIESLLTAMNSAATAPGVRELPTTSLFTRKIMFQNEGVTTRYMPDLRLDWNPTENHQFTATYHYQKEIARPYILSNGDPSFPVPPLNGNTCSMAWDRNLVSMAWRWNLTSQASNELRFGIQSRPGGFCNELNLNLYPLMNTNLGPIRAWPLFQFISTPLRDPVTWGDNAPLGQLTETLSWMKGRHFLSFGASLTETHVTLRYFSEVRAYLYFGLDYEDPAASIFTSANLPRMTSGDRSRASYLYGMLTGRITEYESRVYVNKDTKKFEPGAGWLERTQQREFGFYATDSWRLRPGLTVNAGLRWEYQGVPNSPDNMYWRLKGGYAGLFGVSGLNNLFKPGTLTGSVPVLEPNEDDPLYEGGLTNFAPGVGVAWTPNINNALWRTVFGGQGKTVLRSGYAISFTREGLQLFQVASTLSPQVALVFARPVSPYGPIGPGEFAAGSATLSGGITGLRQVPEEYGVPITLEPGTNMSADASMSRV